MVLVKEQSEGPYGHIFCATHLFVKQHDSFFKKSKTKVPTIQFFTYMIFLEMSAITEHMVLACMMMCPVTLLQSG